MIIKVGKQEKEEGWHNEYKWLTLKSQLCTSGASLCLVSYFSSASTVIVPLLSEALSPLALPVSVCICVSSIWRCVITRPHSCVFFVHVRFDRIWSKRCGASAHRRQIITPKQQCCCLRLQRGAGEQAGREGGRRRVGGRWEVGGRTSARNEKERTPCGVPFLSAPHGFLLLIG